MFDGREQLEEALHTLGALLEHRGISHELVAVGGASLAFLRWRLGHA